ncbi:MAG TPA: hypothetical protein ENJ46_04240 [Hellea balneolensis]|uniref:Heme-binding protein n=1 Tax=Hellea balneolensis TaxID=287478 RepID=A0A7C3G5G9_9PROT|nr:hypothetical protein [Hellea balneolensis]
MKTGAVIACLAVSACGGGGGGSSTTAPATPPPPPPPAPSGVYAQPNAENLSASDVETIIAQAVEEANARNLPSVISVTDRVGNVLAVFRMTGTRVDTTIRAGQSVNTGLQGVRVPHELASISKALTGAYLSSGGNAFSTRTASMIIQQHFPPSANTVGLESGPLFGVQFSQLPCSDFSERAAGGNTLGPKRAPLGISADPGGLPLYKNGVLVGGIGVSGDEDYGFDPEVTDIDAHDEELIAIAGTFGFAAPVSIRADHITVDGTSLRFTDQDESDLVSAPASARTFSQINGALGALVTVNGYYGNGTPVALAGQTYKFESSGIRPSTRAEYANPDIFVMTDGGGNNRFPPRAGTDGADIAQPLTQNEVRTILQEAFDVMSHSRGQIRRPLESRAQVSISVVDTHGSILGIVRAPDAPIFGTDVSLQKARTATFFSGASAATDLAGTLRAPAFGGGVNPKVSGRVAQVRTFLGDANALTGTHAFADRSGGNLSRPYFPDGEVGTANGPLSVPIAQFSPFANGLQEELIEDNILVHVGFVVNNAPANQDTPRRCSFVPDVVAGQNRLQNGMQIFPGSVPIYRNGILIGGVGVSGDGIDQDDMISFLGVHNAGVTLGTLGNADPAIRADNIIVPVNGEDIRLRFVSCPFAPFLDTNEQNVCQGK